MPVGVFETLMLGVAIYKNREAILSAIEAHNEHILAGSTDVPMCPLCELQYECEC